MVSAFIVYDLTFLVVFTLGVIIFLYTHKKNLKREGLLYLYRTRVGINFIEIFTNRFRKILKPLQYLVITSGYILMGLMVYLIFWISWIYLKSPTVAREIKVPILIPLVPYLPDIFQIDFLPSFNFTYWIIVIALIAIPHEFAHGIFARLNKIKIHSTGFGFLGPFLAAFVEQDEKDMAKASKFSQLSVLAAGTFANVIFTIIFALILWGFFASAFTPAGVNFNAYASSIAPIDSIESINGISISSISEIPNAINESVLATIVINKSVFYANTNSLKAAAENNIPLIEAIENSPAFNARLEGAISEINGQKTISFEDLRNALSQQTPGETVEIKTIYRESVRTNEIEERSYTVTLDEREGKAFLGIGIREPQLRPGISSFVYGLTSKVKDPFVFYQSQLGAFGWFIYYLLWWAVVVLISVALVNMLPVGIFDGGRFFYLTAWALTRSEKIGKKAFAISTWLILALVAAMMIKWVLLFV